MRAQKVLRYKKNAFRDPWFSLPRLVKLQKESKIDPKIQKKSKKWTFMGFFTGRLEQISALIIFESAPKSGF